MRTRPDKPQVLDGPSQAWQLVYRALSKVPFLPSPRNYDLSVSHTHRFVWFRVAKCGSQTINHHLVTNHVVMEAHHPSSVFYPVRAYRDYFKFAFVRNPWNRLVSCWYNKVFVANHYKFSDEDHERMKTFANFVDHVAGLDLTHCDIHLRLQCEMIDASRLDFLGRCETLERDLQQVCEMLGLPRHEIETKNASKKKRHYSTYYDETLRDRVYELYRRDVQLFGYTFESDTTSESEVGRPQTATSAP